MKICSRCGKKYPATIEYFRRHNQKRDGLRPECKFCWSDDSKNRYYKRKYASKYYKTVIGHLNGVYQGMKNRCENPEAHNYNCYGGRGIECKFNSRVEFIDYVLKEIFNIDLDGLQIDRTNNNGNYEPGNIRFVTRKENLANRRNSK